MKTRFTALNKVVGHAIIRKIFNPVLEATDIYYGFKFYNENISSDVSNCCKIFTDERFLQVINRLSEQYYDRFRWFYFKSDNGEQEAVLAFYDGKTLKNGMSIQFAIWKHDEREVSLIACHKPDTTETTRKDGFRAWGFENASSRKIISELSILIETYLEKLLTEEND